MMVDNSGKNSNFQVEDILKEARQKKLERLKQPMAAQNSAFPEIKPSVDLGKLVSKKDLLNNASKLQEKEEVKVYTPRGPVKQETEATAVKITDEADVSVGGEQDKNEEIDQIQFDSLLDEIPEESDDKAGDWEEKLQNDRRKKAENFKLHPSAVLRLSGDEEENDPSEEPDTYEEEEIDDFCSYEDTEAVRNELIYRRRTGWVQLVFTGIFSLTLIGISVLYFLRGSSINAVLYVGLNVFLLLISAIVNHRAIGEGLGALLRLRANIDSIISVLTMSTIIHTVLQLISPEIITGGKAVILAPAAAVALFFVALGRQMLIIRIADNFKFVSYRGDKYAAQVIEDSRKATEIGRAAVAIGEPVVCYLEKTEFLTRFLENSYEVEAGNRVMHLYVPFAIGASAVLSVAYVILGGSLMNALTVFVSSILLTTPIGAMTAVNFPILRTARRVLRHGAMLIGWQAAEDFSDIHALAVDALEVFPSESVLLHGIKTFSGTRIDEAILDAAAVSIAAGGPLSNVFRRVIQNRTEILKEVDTLVFEQDMGMSGWVGGRRVLIGNRRLLENHGVDVPSRDYEARYATDTRQIVYLSTAGELSAMFVVSYVSDEGIAKALKSLCGARVTLLVRTCDPNVTEELICQTFDLDPYYVEVMSAPAGRCYEQLIDVKREENDAVLASNGRLEGTAFGVTYSRRLYKAVHLALIIQVIGGAIGLSLAVIMSLYTGILISPLMLIAYSLVWTALSWIIPCIKRV